MEQLQSILQNPEAKKAWDALPAEEREKVMAELYPAAGMRSEGGTRSLIDVLAQAGTASPESRYPAAGMRTAGALRPGREVASEAVRVAGSLPPGPVGMATSFGGNVLADLIEGHQPDLTRASTAAGVTGLMGGLGMLARPLSKARIAGTGKAKDAALVADAVRGTGTALQPSDAVGDLFNTMRGKPGGDALGKALGDARADLASKLPSSISPKGMPPPNPRPPLFREEFTESTGKLTDLGERGFNLRGAARDSPLAQRARRQYGAERKDLTEKLKQTGPDELAAFEKQNRDFSAGQELRRLFRPNSGEGPDRVFRPGGFNMQDVQERAGRRVAEIQGRLGQSEGDAFLEKLYRGGKPGEGTDRPLALSSSKFGGFRIPLGLEILAGKGMDPTKLQMLLQGGGNFLLDALRQ